MPSNSWNLPTPDEVFREVRRVHRESTVVMYEGFVDNTKPRRLDRWLTKFYYAGSAVGLLSTTTAVFTNEIHWYSFVTIFWPFNLWQHKKEVKKRAERHAEWSGELKKAREALFEVDPGNAHVSIIIEEVP